MRLVNDTFALVSACFRPHCFLHRLSRGKSKSGAAAQTRGKPVADRSDSEEDDLNIVEADSAPRAKGDTQFDQPVTFAAKKDKTAH